MLIAPAPQTQKAGRPEISPGSARHGRALDGAGLFRGRGLPTQVRGCNRPACMAAGREGAHHAASARRTPGFRIDVRIGVQGVVHLLVMGLRRQGRPRSGSHRPIWLRTALLRPRQPGTVRQRCGAAHPHVEAPQGWSGMHRARRPFRFAGLLCRLEPLPGQRPAVHAVPAGQTVPSILQAGMHRIT